MEDSIKQQAQRQFAKNAAKYVTSPGHAAGEDLAYLISASGAEKHMDVLDIATGGGHTANALAPLVRSVIAYDLTEEMLAAAEAFITGNGWTNVSFEKGDAEKMPFSDAAFDIVTCRIAAHHFPDVRAFVHEAFRVVKPGGRLLLIDNTAPEKDEYDHFYNDIEKKRDQSHFRAWKKTEWLRFLETAGFRMESAVCFLKPFQFTVWCERAGLTEEKAALLEKQMLDAPRDIQRFFSVKKDQSGRIAGFTGESACFCALRPV
ncbi:class I SAM-dependent methyltransferase [Bacillus sp. 2211]|uniref:class I SAM-dependent methyltransferase n=1 Tax=Bacillus TaxID=1386 RepID=UPI00165F0B35|nr:MULTISPECIES: class I SAM-dependent methyltransferase [Bacillus]MBD0398792.1 class I SAM-dependent methyltransferase [Bacillus sp. 2211]MED4525170.1 class I SAM-dependent methyltransferase [Bacillus velezensis]